LGDEVDAVALAGDHDSKGNIEEDEYGKDDTNDEVGHNIEADEATDGAEEIWENPNQQNQDCKSVPKQGIFDGDFPFCNEDADEYNQDNRKGDEDERERQRH